MKKSFRPGAIGALLDEYERAISELKTVIADIPEPMLTTVIDPHTSDEDCRSFQTILSYVIHSGYGYATSIHNSKGNSMVRPEKTHLRSIAAYQTNLSALFSFTEKVFREIKENELEQMDETLKIRVAWGQSYDIEQLTEHAIVHILRHRRQIEKFKTNLLK